MSEYEAVFMPKSEQMSRCKELMDCFRNAIPGQPHCAIMDENTYWEGERWTETHLNGDSMTLSGMIIPLSTQFLVCKNHEPKEIGNALA
jgi:hypothetical protein